MQDPANIVTGQNIHVACGKHYATDSGSASGPSVSKSMLSPSAGKRVVKGTRSQTNLKDGTYVIVLICVQFVSAHCPTEIPPDRLL